MMDTESEKMLMELAPEYVDVLEMIKKHQIPESYPLDDMDLLAKESNSLGPKSLFFREVYVSYCGCCLLSYDWIRPLADWIGTRTCLEIMAGSGALSMALKNCGVSIVATDDFSWGNELWLRSLWTDVECIDARATIDKHKADIVICSWPPIGEPIAKEALLKMRAVNPNALMIYIGEPAGASCADDDFFETLHPVNDRSFYKAVKTFKPFYTLHDRPYLIR